jgi:hypothetical protein
VSKNLKVKNDVDTKTYRDEAKEMWKSIAQEIKVKYIDEYQKLIAENDCRTQNKILIFLKVSRALNPEMVL